MLCCVELCCSSRAFSSDSLAATMISCLNERMRRNSKSFWGSRSRTRFLARSARLGINSEYCLVKASCIHTHGQYKAPIRSQIDA